MNYKKVKKVDLEGYGPMSKKELSQVVGGIQAGQVLARSALSYHSGYYSSGSGCDGVVVCLQSCGSAVAAMKGATPITELPIGETIMLNHFGGLHVMRQGGELELIGNGNSGN